MTDKELLNKFTSIETRLTSQRQMLKTLKESLKSVRKQTPILTEFRQETVTNLDKIEN